MLLVVKHTVNRKSLDTSNALPWNLPSPLLSKDAR